MSISGFTMYTYVEDYGKPYEVLKNNDGEYTGAGVFTPNVEKWEEFSGVVVNLTPEDFKSDNAGIFTTQDRNLYTLDRHEIGNIVKYKNICYKIHSELDISDFEENVDSFDDSTMYVYRITKEDRMGGGRNQL